MVSIFSLHLAIWQEWLNKEVWHPRPLDYSLRIILLEVPGIQHRRIVHGSLPASSSH
jgi:hypothetical protein